MIFKSKGVKKMDKITFHRISFDVTFRCTLKCKLCCAYAPYFPTPVPHYSFAELTGWIKRFFELADNVDIFTFGGGEPFLHENLAELVDFVGNYRERIGRLEVITNGTILPSEKLIKSLKDANARVLLDDYGPKLSVKAPEIAEIFEKNDVNFEYRHNSNTENGAHCNGWFDVVHFLDEPVPYEDAKRLFDKCIQAHELRCHPVIDGKIYICPAYERCVRINKVPDDSEYFIDLSDNVTSLEEQKEKVKKYLEIDYIPSCAFCNGFCKDSKRYVPAEQLTMEELREIRAEYH